MPAAVLRGRCRHAQGRQVTFSAAGPAGDGCVQRCCRAGCSVLAVCMCGLQQVTVGLFYMYGGLILTNITGLLANCPFCPCPGPAAGPWPLPKGPGHGQKGKLACLLSPLVHTSLTVFVQQAAAAPQACTLKKTAQHAQHPSTLKHRNGVTTHTCPCCSFPKVFSPAC